MNEPTKENLEFMLNQHLKYYKWVSKKSKNDILDIRVKKIRTVNTGLAIVNKIKEIEFEKLVQYLYCPDQKDSTELTKRFKYQFFGAHTEPDAFIKGLYKFYQSIKVYIKKENKVETFINLFHYWVENNDTLLKNDEQHEVVTAFIDLLIQTFEFISPGVNKIVCGLSLDNKIITTPDPYPYCDCPSYDIEDAIIKGDIIDELDGKMRKYYKKYGYNITNQNDAQRLQSMTQITNNNLIYMSYFINENTIDIIPQRPFSYDENFYIEGIPFDADNIDNKLNKRKYVLPVEGVIGEYSNIENIDKILFKEIYKNDIMYLLFRIFTPCGEFSGHYSPHQKYFYSIFKGTNRPEFDINIKSVVLSTYQILTCKENKNYHLISSYDYEGPEPLVKLYYFSNETKKIIAGKDNSKIVVGKKSRYKQKHYKNAEIAVNGYIRRLPTGYQASNEAIILADKLGYELENNETFVRPFIKKMSSKEKI